MNYESRPAWRYQWAAVVAMALMAGAMLLASLYGPTYLGARAAQMVSSAALALAFYFVLLALYRHFAWRYLVDEHNIESYHGVLARQVRSIRVADLRNINVSQSVMQRLLDVGDVEFSSAAGGDVEVIFFGVPEPMQVKEFVRRLQDGAPSSTDAD
jgi:membrane protein YdbS with pleckstrin-like domain